MLNTMVSLVDHEKVKITRKTPYDKPSGAEGYKEEIVGEFDISVQGIKSSIQVEGYVLDKTLAGNKLDSTFICYSSNIPVKAGDILQRIERDNLLYEVVATEPKGVGTILEQRVMIIERVDNQGGNDAESV